MRDKCTLRNHAEYANEVLETRESVIFVVSFSILESCILRNFDLARLKPVFLPSDDVLKYMVLVSVW